MYANSSQTNSEFFANPKLLRYLQEAVLPELIARARAQSKELRIWLVGCSTGEAAYALAILLAEAIGNRPAGFNLRIFATDVDEEALAIARRGRYPAAALTGLTDELIGRYFIHDDGSYQIKKALRMQIVFGQHDLHKHAPFPRIDLLLCRHVPACHTAEAQDYVLRKFAYALRDGGYLLLDQWWTTATRAELFELHSAEHHIYRRRHHAGPSPMAGEGPGAIWRTAQTELPAMPTLAALSRHGPAEPGMPGRQQEPPEKRNLLSMSWQHLPMGVVVIDRRYHIQMINNAARRFLAIYGPAIGEDLIHATQAIPYISLRAAIDSAFHSGTPVSIDELVFEDQAAGQSGYLRITCHPQRAGEQGPVDTMVVVIHDITDFVWARQQLEQQLQIANAELQKARREVEQARGSQIVQQLMEAIQQLQETNRRLTDANEELRMTQEQLMLSAERAEAAGAEIEALNEELQAANEELQATNEELRAMNSDLEARSSELQELAQAHAQERARLAAILASMGDGVIVVNKAGQAVLTNAAYEQMFGSASAGSVFQDQSGRILAPEETPLQRAARGESFRMEFSLLAPDGTRRWFEAHGQPIADSQGDQQGGVVVIRDFTDRSIRRLQEEFVTLASHELRTPLTPIQGSLQMLLKQLKDVPENAGPRHYAEVALTQVRRLVRLVNDLFDMTRLQSGQYHFERERLRLDHLVARTVEVAQMMAAGQKIYLDSAATDLYVQGDAGRLEQALLNLLTNAITYAPNTERIDVRLRCVGDEVEIQVQDYGPGIAEADLPYIFSRFYRAKSREYTSRTGLGLGLYITREIVIAHGGRIEVTSAQGQGTTFTIRLPLMAEAGDKA
jgi:two-component system CheB/CheR fusion protein